MTPEQCVMGDIYFKLCGLFTKNKFTQKLVSDKFYKYLLEAFFHYYELGVQPRQPWPWVQGSYILCYVYH